MNFLELAETFAIMEKTTSRLELTDHLVSILKKTPTDIIDKIVYLIQGKLGPDYESSELGIADKLIIKSLSLVSGHSLTEIQNKYSDIGDLGEVAYNILTEQDTNHINSSTTNYRKRIRNIIKDYQCIWDRIIRR